MVARQRKPVLSLCREEARQFCIGFTEPQSVILDIRNWLPFKFVEHTEEIQTVAIPTGVGRRNVACKPLFCIVSAEIDASKTNTAVLFCWRRDQLSSTRHQGIGNPSFIAYRELHIQLQDEVRFRALLRHGRGQLPASPVTLASDSDDWCAEHFLVGTALRGVEETGTVPCLDTKDLPAILCGDLSIFRSSQVHCNC